MKMVLKKFITGCQKRVCPSIMVVKKESFPGQEGVIDLDFFSLEGGEKVYQKRPEQNKRTRLYDTCKIPLLSVTV